MVFFTSDWLLCCWGFCTLYFRQEADQPLLMQRPMITWRALGYCQYTSALNAHLSLLCVYVSACLSVCLSVSLSICLSVCHTCVSLCVSTSYADLLCHTWRSVSPHSSRGVYACKHPTCVVSKFSVAIKWFHDPELSDILAQGGWWGRAPREGGMLLMPGLAWQALRFRCVETTSARP